MSDPSSSASPDVAVIGGGPAGLMAAHRLALQGWQVTLFDGSASVGRKFLLAGRGGLNLTHSEPAEPFVGRYGPQQGVVGDWLHDFGPQHVQDWAHGLGIETFVGTSGRVFPTDMKAAPLLRSWLVAMRAAGVRFAMRHRWLGFGENNALRFATPQGEVTMQARATVLALGGGSWARLGSDGAWAPVLQQAGIEVAPLQAANCGFEVRMQRGADGSAQAGWSPFFSDKYAGQPFKSVAITFDSGSGRPFVRKGEFVATEHGVEGSLVYAVSSALREAIKGNGGATFTVDLLPDHSTERVLAEVRHPRGSRSLASHLKGRLGLDGIKAALLFEVLGKDGMQDAERLAATIKAAPITVVATRPMDEAISTAGGVAFAGLTPDLMCRAMPGLFCAGEMLDWEAPTGGYLLTAALASGVRAAQGVERFLEGR
ncbi:putative flavoprotein (TIGR03862 family) [Comamonas odontotermitis]|uniref:Flavoprotein (TIGR03862 family) n=1 Tax=Comamonas odontotermitis TaxID=379895 RepID=A0ABR6RJH4_9BURK|nr:TIGR03862 family flavoprotein [Comamonas odontotermitis]MBB6579178.1 putative flavoprotein (TIGR03862 family) [Comamonas odontotermitis]